MRLEVQGQKNPPTTVVVAVSWIVPVAFGGAAVIGVVVPRTPTQDAVQRTETIKFKLFRLN